MQGVILAAGQGTRMGNLEIPKCLLKIDDITLIEYQLMCLKKLGIDDILIVTGYNDQMIKQHLGSKVKYAFNKNFENTNNLHSLSKAKDFVTNDFICLHADLLFHPDILRKCVEHKSMICLAVERNTRDETMRVEIDQKNIKVGKAGRTRWKGQRPQSRGVVMNPVDHPHGGGEGKSSGGRNPVSPWGQSAKGLKTRKPKRSDKFIISRRKKRNKR